MKARFIPDLIVKSLHDISPELLHKNGLSGIMVDLDNTLASYHAKEPDDEVVAWVKTLDKYGIKISIISNNNQKRVDDFNIKLGLLNSIGGANKPFSKSFLEVAEKMGLPPKEIAVIGDQIFTDVLGGNSAGMFTIMVNPGGKQPNILYQLRRLAETPFIRKYERRTIKNEKAKGLPDRR